MEAGVSNHVWAMEEIIALEPAPAANRPKTYKNTARQRERRFQLEFVPIGSDYRGTFHFCLSGNGLR